MGSPECLWEGVSTSVHLGMPPVSIPHEPSAPASTTQPKCSLIPGCFLQDPNNHRASASISVALSALPCSSFSSFYSSTSLLQPLQPSQGSLAFLPCHWTCGDRPGFSLLLLIPLLPNIPPLDPTSSVHATQDSSTTPPITTPATPITTYL